MTIKINKLRNIIFLLLIFLISTQLGRHFWPTWSLVNGIRIDYLSPTIYVTDVLILLLIFFELIKRRGTKLCARPNRRLGTPGSHLRTPTIIIIFLFLLLTANFSFISFIKFIKIIEIITFAYLVKIHLNKITFPRFVFVLSLSMLFQSFLALAQFVNHGSLNGIFYWLGERSFTASTPGIANASINGNLILRPYGTLPHPNVLAGFLLLGIIIICRGTPWRALGAYHGKPLQKIFIYFVLLMSSIVLFLTLSRVAILLWFGFVVFNFIRRGRPPGRPYVAQKRDLGQTRRFVPTMIIIFLIVVLFLYFLFPRFISIFTEDSESFTARFSQTKIVFQMIKDHPVFGVGLNQYLVELPKYLKNASFRDYQPVHNVFLLVLSEIGVFGFLVVGVIAIKLLNCYIVKLLRTKNNNLTIQQFSNGFLILVVLVISLFDHYFYTTQQGNLMIGLVMGILNSKFEYRNSKQ